jgi:hypothetical protein
MTMKTMIALSTVLALAACGKKDKDGGSSGGGGGSVDPAAANAAIPAAWKGKLEFSAQKLGKGKFGPPVSVAAPKGWKDGFMDGSLEPADGTTTFGFGVSFKAGGTCGGECKKKPAAEWETAANTSYFDNILAHKPPPKIIKDEKSAGRRVMVAKDQYTDGNQNKTMIVVATWTDNDEHFFACSVDLTDKEADLATAFEKACATVTPAD